MSGLFLLNFGLVWVGIDIQLHLCKNFYVSCSRWFVSSESPDAFVL
jgi:hypothetical protein